MLQQVIGKMGAPIAYSRIKAPAKKHILAMFETVSVQSNEFRLVRPNSSGKQRKTGSEEGENDSFGRKVNGDCFLGRKRCPFD